MSFLRAVNPATNFDNGCQVSNSRTYHRSRCNGFLNITISVGILLPKTQLERTDVALKSRSFLSRVMKTKAILKVWSLTLSGPGFSEHPQAKGGLN